MKYNYRFTTLSLNLHSSVLDPEPNSDLSRMNFKRVIRTMEDELMKITFSNVTEKPKLREIVLAIVLNFKNELN